MPILTETFEGSPGGMNLAFPAQELDDTECRYIQDGLVDQPGLTRRRGPITAIAGLPALSYPASGIAATTDPFGSFIIGVLNGDGGSNNLFSAYSSDRASKVDLAFGQVLPTSPPGSPYRIVDNKPMLNAGTLLGVSSQYDANGPVQTLTLWRGGNKANYTTGTLSVTRGTTGVVGVGTTWAANVSPGMFLFANTDDPYTSAFIGVVQSVTNNTNIVLEKAAPFTCTAKAYTLQALRGFCPKVAKGRITTDTTSTIVTGANTKFSSQAMATGSWHIYRSSDDAFVGKVTSVQTDLALTLTANAGVACNNERFYAVRADGDFNTITTANINKVGFLNAVYAGRQWYANNGSSFNKTSNLWFSETSDPEAVDLSPFDGDFIPVASTTGAALPIVSIMPAQNGLCVFKENETFILLGNSPTSFNIKKLEDDGALSGMSVQPYGGGVIWAGREGIHFYDGVQATNLTASKLGTYWKDTIRNFDPTKYRMWSSVARDHYMLFIESVSPTIPVIKGTTSSTPTRYTVTINMISRAVTILTNVDIRGSLQLPAAQGGNVFLVVNDASKGVIVDAGALFNTTGIDSFACAGSTIGPDFVFESKKFSAGDSLRKKLFKQLALQYQIQGDSLRVDTVLGLNNVGQQSTSVFPASGYTWDTLKVAVATWDQVKAAFPTWNDVVIAVFVPKRVKFLKRNQHLSFRLYQNSASVTRLQLGPYQVGYKLQRPGRI